MIRPIVLSRKGNVIDFFGNDPTIAGSWSLDGHARDESRKGLNGTISGGVTFQNYNNKNFADFNGVDGFISAGTTSSFNFLHNTTALFTVLAFVRLKVSHPSGGFFSIISTSAGSSAFIGTDIFIDDRQIEPKNLAVRFFIMRGVSAQPVISFSTSDYAFPNDKGSHLIAVTYNQSLASKNCCISIDGVQLAVGSKNAYTPSSANSSYALRMGAIGDGSFFSLHFQNNTAIFNRVLSISEISQYYQWSTSAPRKYWFYSPQIITGVSPYYYQELCKRRAA